MKRDYQNDYGSVTQILGILRKIGLERWFQWNDGRWCNEESKRGREIGTQIHEAIQSHIELKEAEIKTQYGEEVMNALNGFMLFKKAHPEIKLKRSEIALTSLIHCYNGTMDVEAEIESVVVPGDWKTGKCKDEPIPPIYDEYIYQVAAYLKAFNEVKKQDAKKAFIVVFAKDKVAYNYRLLEEEEVNDAFNKAFLPALKIYNYQKRYINYWKGGN